MWSCSGEGTAAAGLAVCIAGTIVNELLHQRASGEVGRSVTALQPHMSLGYARRQWCPMVLNVKILALASSTSPIKSSVEVVDFSHTPSDDILTALVKVFLFFATLHIPCPINFGCYHVSKAFLFFTMAINTLRLSRLAVYPILVLFVLC
jgi:hypothetical protein